MGDQTETDYPDGEVVWVKLGSCWWPGEVVGPEKLPPDVLPSFRKPPIAVVKFFQEDSYEYVKNEKGIYKYNCSRKNEFINKGLYMYRTKQHMEKFPEDVIRAETAVGGDIEILTRDEFQEVKKESYAGIFGDTVKKTPASNKKGRGRGRPRSDSESPPVITPAKRKHNYKAFIIVQNKEETPSTPSTSHADPEAGEDGSAEDGTPEADSPATASTQSASTPSSTPVSRSGNYACPSCPFSTTRLNVLILHTKAHSFVFTPYTLSPAPKNVVPKATKKGAPKITKTPKTPRQRKEKPAKPPKERKPQGKKRSAEQKSEVAVKKAKTDVEIKSSLLADWDEIDDGSNDELAELTIEAESPAVPTLEELPSAPTPVDLPLSEKKTVIEGFSSAEKPESGDSKYEFCEDEDWHVEADGGRKIPRVKNPKRKEGNKSLSLDDDEVAKEVAELLNKTALPELPSIPEPLKVEENFPEPSIVKSPDKTAEQTSPEAKSSETVSEIKPTKAIFKTKTFFRSRHSRSQDAIGKYVAEQLNAAERMDMIDSDLNGSEAVSSPEARDSPPIEPVKVARLAPKIQLKKMKAEAAQLQKEKNQMPEKSEPEPECSEKSTSTFQDVLWGSQEIKPINKENPDKLFPKESSREEPGNETIGNTKSPKRKVPELSPMEDFNQVTNVSTLEKSPLNATESLDTDESNSKVAFPPTPSPKSSTYELNIESYELTDTSPEKLDRKSPIKTKKMIFGSPEKQEDKPTIISPKKMTIDIPQKIEDKSTIKSPKKITIDTLQKLEHKSPVKFSKKITILSPLKLGDKSPKKIVIDSPQKTDDGLKSPMKMVMDKSPIAPESIQKSPVNIELYQSPKKIERVQKSPITMFIDSSPQRDAQDEQKSSTTANDGSPQKVQGMKKSPIKLFVGRSPQKVRDGGHKSPKNKPQLLIGSDKKSPITIVIDRKSLQKVGDCDQAAMNIIMDRNPQMGVVVEPTSSKVQEVRQPTLVQPEPFMSESTASAVDALLSVSRETDRVPKIVSDDPPEDLFEDDLKDSSNKDTEVKNNDSQANNIEASNDKLNPMETEITHGQNGISNKAVNNLSKNEEDTVSENLPSESDLQIAQALINLPSTAIQNKLNEHQELLTVPIGVDNQEIFTEEVISSEGMSVTEERNEIIASNEIDTNIDTHLKLNSNNQNLRFETEQEKSENFSAAQSLVQMSESVDHNINIVKAKVSNKDVKATYKAKQNNRKADIPTVDNKVTSLSIENNTDDPNSKNAKSQTASSKLMMMLEEPGEHKPSSSSFSTTPVKQATPVKQSTPVKQATPSKQMVVTGKEKILNFDVAKSSVIEKSQSTKQKIIIRRAGSTKGFLNNLNEVVASPDKIILSRSNLSSDGSSIQTFTIQGPPAQDSQPDHVKPIIVQPKIRKISNTPTKLQKLKTLSLVSQSAEPQSTKQSADLFDINSMPVVLSDDLITPENIEKMPVVMSDGNLIAPTTPNPCKQPTSTMSNPPKLVKHKPTITESEKAAISRSEVKTLLMSSSNEVSKVTTTPNILSKSSKKQIRGGKPMLVIDKATGKQKIVVGKPDNPALIQIPQAAMKTDKFIILPSASSPKPTGRTQKIVIDPQTGKAHVIVTKGQDAPQNIPENKPVSAKLIPSSSDTGGPGSTVMIITNAQGAQSRIVLTPEHEKILFPHKQTHNISQLKSITQRINTNTGVLQKVPTNAGILQKAVITSAPIRPQTKIISKQKNAIITSKGQLIVGGRVATATQNIAPMPETRQAKPEIRPLLKPELHQLTKLETRPTLKRIVPSDPKKVVQTIQKSTSEPLIFLQQKSGAVMQLTAAQFEHLQRTGQIVQKTVPAPEKKIVVQKSITIPAKDSGIPTIQKQRVRKSTSASHTLAKRAKQDIAMVATTAAEPPVPPLTSLSYTPAAPAQAPAIAPAHASTVSISSIVPSVMSTGLVASTQSYPELDNFEELLPSTAIARQAEPQPASEPKPQPDPIVAQPDPIIAQPDTETERAPESELVSDASAAPLSDGQLLAVPGETVGGLPGAFYLCVEENGTYTPIDNRPLILENDQLVPIAVDPVPVYQQPERRDILEAALANSDVFHADTNDAPDFRDLNANVSVHCRVSETSTTLNQPIMTPVEIPSKGDLEPTTVASNLEDGLAVIGVTPHTVPTSLELPITVTDPRIAPKTTNPLTNNNYGPTLLPSPSTELSYVSVPEAELGRGVSMPVLSDDAVGKSMPILTDDVSSVESIECEDDGARAGWARALLTPGSDISETSAEIPVQPALRFSVDDLTTHA